MASLLFSLIFKNTAKVTLRIHATKIEVKRFLRLEKDISYS